VAFTPSTGAAATYVISTPVRGCTLPDDPGSPDPQPGLLERLPHRGVLG
jgi:hypothetical protein